MMCERIILFTTTTYRHGRKKEIEMEKFEVVAVGNSSSDNGAVRMVARELCGYLKELY